MAVSRVDELDRMLSVFRKSSEVTRVNQAAGQDFVSVSAETLHIIKTALRISGLSEGAFDITMRPLVKLWGIANKKNFIPDKDEIQKALALVNYRDIRLDEKRNAGYAVQAGSIN